MTRLTLVLTLIGCGPKPPAAPEIPETETPEEPEPVAPAVGRPAAEGIENEALRTIVQGHWEGLMMRHPTWASALGDHRYDDRVDDLSPAAESKWRERQHGWLTELQALDGLSASDALNRDLLAHELRTDLALAVCQNSAWAFSPRSNPMDEGNQMAAEFRMGHPGDAKNLIARVRAHAEAVDQRIENVRKGLSEGRVANATSTSKVIEQTRAELAKEVADTPMVAALERLPSPPENLGALQAEMSAATETWRAAITRWVEFLETEVLPKARKDPEGLTGIPDGAACYAAAVESHTSLPLDPDTLHQTGLDEIARLHREVSMLGKRALDTSDVQKIFDYLRTDERLYFETEDQVEAKAEEALGRAKAAIPAYFGRLPKADCQVRRIPDYQAPYTTIAYYMPVKPGEAPGYYYVNTYKPETRPRHEAEVLAFHESIPGHHLQIAIAQELEAMPEFRKHLGATAFVEGWALYSEQLSDEMGLYTSDTDRFGMYSFELWRAARLVVDTGIHAKGWSRKQAIDFMVENTPLAPNNIENEVDRYITTPGQALAYKTGQLEIWRLRRDAEARLGESFDIKGFHDVVLEAGAVSLPVLGARVDAWVKSRQ